MELSISHKLFKNIKNNRWQHEFHDREKIGAGGFASVYKVKNCYDDHLYAVKKVKLQFKDIRRNFEQELQKILDEAKFLAKVKHENILRYYGSWLEATTKPNGPIKRNSTLKPSIFKKEKENMDMLNMDTLKDIDNEGNDHEEHSPIVVFGETEKANEDSESSPFFSFQKEERKPVKNCSNFAQRRLGLNKRLDLQEGLKISSKLRVSTSQPDECSTPLVRGEKLENIILFIQTELCSNTLESYIDSRNSLLQDLRKQNPVEYMKKRNEYLREALCFSKQILNGLSHIHSHHVVHRDLKPSNIFIAGKTCKIGDFGLVKQLEALYPVENSPFIQEPEKIINPVETSTDLKAPNRYDKLCLLTKKSSSDPSFAKERAESSPETESCITKSIGTRMYASPEQWLADKDSFDQRADIFSLGVCFLLLFHPMSTYMERTNIIKDSKDGKIPDSMEKELPEIAKIIKQMLSLEPSSRPCIEKIIQSLKLPMEIKSQFCGNVKFRRENGLKWRKKYFKIIDGNLHLYNREKEIKAENIYNLSHWTITLEESEKPVKRRETVADQSKDCHVETSTPKPKERCIRLESPDQIGCEFKAEDLNRLNDLFKAFEEYKTTD